MSGNTLLLLLLLCAGNVAYTQPVARAIWIDTDIRLGKPGRDVDDGLALIIAVQSKEVFVEGISVTGNVGYASNIAKKIVKEYSAEHFVAVHKGARNHNDIGKETAATEALKQKLQQKKLTILALGLLTNIATVIQIHPELSKQIQEVVFCGSRQLGQHFKIGSSTLNIPDANFERDPNAFNIILRAGIPITFVGFESAQYIKIYKKDIIFLKDSPYKPEHWLYKKLRLWQLLWKMGVKDECFIPFDVVTLGSLIAPLFFQYFNSVTVHVDTLRNDLFIPLFNHRTKPYLNVINTSGTISSDFRYCYQTQPQFKDYILSSLRQNVYSQHRTQKNKMLSPSLVAIVPPAQAFVGMQHRIMSSRTNTDERHK